MHTYASEAINVHNTKKDAVKVDDRTETKWKDKKWGGKNGLTQEEEREKYQGLRLHYCETVLHKRKCIQHHSPAIEETEIEKGTSEFAHLGKTSHWRQSISNSVLLKRAQRKYSNSQHKRSWHTFQSIGSSQCAGKFLLKRICFKM